MLRRFLVLVCALSLLGACVPPEESNDKIKRYDPEENIMGQIQERGVLLIGVPVDYPPFAILDDDGVKGFVVDLGNLVAEALGVKAQFIPAPNRVLLDMVYSNPKTCAEETDADLVFPMVPITEEMLAGYTFTDPYWVGHTRSLLDGDTEVKQGPDVNLLAEAYADHGLEVGGEQQSTEGYGAASRCGTTTFGTIVSQVFNEADAEGDWSRSYDEWMADYFVDPDPADVPIMSVEDAAALYPAEL